MTTSIARQSIVIKCNLKESVMLGNYEFYYAAGLISKFTGEQFDLDKEPKELYEQVKQVAEKYQTEDEKMKYLIHILLEYKPEEGKDDQMLELFSWGQKEQNLWQENS